MKRLFRNANLGLVAMVVVVLVGFWPAHGSDTAVEALSLAAFFIGLGVYLTLNIRDDRARRKDSVR